MNESEVEQLLRQDRPEIGVRPGLETRIRASLRSAPKANNRTFAWIALPSMAIVALFLIIVLRSQPEESGQTAEYGTQPPSSEVVKSLVPEVETDKINTLRTETRALKNEAARTGRFLLDCLPSLAMAEK